MPTRALVILLMLIGGCASSQPPDPMPPTHMPEPGNFAISGTLTANLTPQMIVLTGLPATLKATLDVSARSEAISASPLRSRHEGHMSLIVTDDSGKVALVNVNIKVSGEMEGSPAQGLNEVIKRFLDAASLMARPVPQLGQPAH